MHAMRLKPCVMFKDQLVLRLNSYFVSLSIKLLYTCLSDTGGHFPLERTCEGACQPISPCISSGGHACEIQIGVYLLTGWPKNGAAVGKMRRFLNNALMQVC